MPFTQIRKRSGAIVDFDLHRIENAMEKAFQDVGTPIPSEELSSIAERVETVLTQRIGEETTPSVEQIQDTVEEILGTHGYFDVAKAYILYRAERAKEREVAETARLAEVSKRKFHVTTRTGEQEAYNRSKIEEVLRITSDGKLKDAQVKQLTDMVESTLFDGISTKEVSTAIILVLRGFIERDPLFAYLAGRVLMYEEYRQVLDVYENQADFADVYRNGFAAYVKRAHAAGRLDDTMLDFDHEKLAAALLPERDHLFQYMGAQVIYDRYGLRDIEQNLLEIPQYYWMRLAMGLCLLEKDKEAAAIQLYHQMSQLRYVPSSPTQIHAGTPRAQMSSCYLTTVEDDLHHIFKCIGDNAQLAKWSGGVANDWSNIRAVNAMVQSINISSQGVVPFLKIVDSTTASINRSGKRRGATCVYLESWHLEVEDFLELRKNTGDERRRTHDVNTANWIPDIFMQRVRDGKDWTLFSPEEVPDLHHIYGLKFKEAYENYEKLADEGKIRLFKRIPAQTLWRKMIAMIFETGHPWITFKDPCNLRSPQGHVGVVHSSNLCTEITLNTSKEETAVCNLGSINLSNHVKDGAVDWDLLKETATMAVRALDNVIDLNFYPTEEGKVSNLRHRPVGLGIMGYQDLLYMVGLEFDSAEAVALSDQLMEFISYHAILASSELAKERGAYATFKGSYWDRNIFPVDTVAILEKERGESTGVALTAKLDWTPVRESVKKHGMRNSNVMAIAPTATISNISGCLPSIEPIYKNLYVKSNFSGEFTILNSYLITELKKLKLWNEDILVKIKQADGSIADITEIPAEVRARFKEAFEIDPTWVIQHAAARGKWIDQSQSINLWIRSTSGRAISDMYQEAWARGLKTTYYLRSLAATGIEKSTVGLKQSAE
jgi:ribonucleoside-diphosphate reductase alpha chain